MPNIYWILAIFAFGGFTGWHGHTWYDGYIKSKQQDAIISDRIVEEKVSNNDAAKTESKEAEDDKKAKAEDVALDTHIAQDKHGYDCAVPANGVRDLQQAVATHTRASKPH